MGRRSDSGRSGAEERAEAVLEHGAAVTAVELAALVHEVNPTGRDLPAAVARRRYALKSRLQSLLVRRHADELRITPSSFADGTVTIVAIDHRYSGRDACHARLDELDEDARARVRLVLDLAAHESARDPVKAPSPTRSARESRAPGDPLEEGRQALEEYDFERARAAFTRAFEASDGAPEAAVALLELLVEQLCLDADALALEDALDARSGADGRIRGLLALAAVRSGELARGRLLMRGAAGTALADALALLARAELSGGDPEAAASSLARLREADPAHPEIVSLAGELSARRAAARRPLEEELERAVRAGDRERIRAQAEELLRRFPDSAVAGRALRTLEAEEKAHRFEELLTRIDAAMAADSDTAAALVEEARVIFPADPRLGERRSRVEADARRRAARRAVEEVLRQLASDGAHDHPAGLVAWMGLDAPQREEVRGRSAAEVAPLLDALAGAEIPASGARRRTLAEAVIALHKAEGALAAGRLEEAEGLIEGHPQLHALPAARPVREHLAQALTARDQARTKERLSAAVAAAARGEAEEAARLVANVQRALLSPEDVARFDELSARLRAGAEREALLRHARALVAAEKFLAGREHARRLVADENAPVREREEAAALVAKASRGVRRWFRLEAQPVEEADRALERRTLRASSGLFALPIGATAVVSDDGRTLWALDVVPDHLLVREIDLDARRTRRVLRLIPPRQVFNAYLAAGRGVLWLHGLHEAACALDPEQIDVRAFVADAIPRGSQVFQADAPDGEHLWLRTFGAAGKGMETVVLCIDGERSPTRTHVSVQALLAGPAPAMLFSMGAGAEMCAPDGRSLTPVPLAPGDTPHGVVVHPEGRGVIYLVHRQGEGGAEERVALAPGEGRELPIAPGGGYLHGVTSLESRSLFIGYDDAAAVRRLRCVRDVGGGLETVWDEPCDGELSGDLFARRAVRTKSGANGFHFEVLGPERPPVRPAEPCSELPHVQADHYCGVPMLAHGMRRFLKALRNAGNRHGIARALREEFPEDEDLPLLDYLVSLHELAEVREKLIPPERRLAPGTLRLWNAHVSGEEGKWESVLATLDPELAEERAADEARTGAERTHALHLRGTALARLGRLAEARDLWRTGAAGRCESSRACHLHACADWADALLAPPGTPGAGPTRALVAAIRDHDHHAGRGEHAAALAAIDVADVHRENELQSHARLTEALLRMPAGAGAGRLLREHTLHRFLSLHEITIRDELWLPAAWNTTRVAALAERAEAELGRLNEAWLKEFDRDGR